MKVLPIQRFVAKVDFNGRDGCWEWTGATDPTGYGRFFVDGTMQYAHRWSYETFVGPIPAGLDIDHLCRVRRCVCPGHLEAVTRRENLLRGETLAAAHAAGVDCGFAACVSCRRHRVVPAGAA